VVIPFEPLWEQYERIIKHNGAIVLTAAEPFTSFLVVSNHKLFRYDLVWDKIVATGFLNANRMPMRKHENILVFYKSLPVYNKQKMRRSLGTHHPGKPEVYMRSRGYVNKTNYGEIKDAKRSCHIDLKLKNPDSILEISRVRGTQKSTNHHTEKPVPLFEYLIKTYTNEGETVLDSVIGSGTTAVAAFRTGRRWIGMEKDPEIFEKACERIERDTKQQNLFTQSAGRYNNGLVQTAPARRNS